ncbi:olfactory receptor 5G9-like [Aquarana catesbeiana]|uniref:olfactory receptor 5G9-like n=1 Tax=Aquarana catesbeiana TaxID=8400 RepID=UPI003CC9A694
MNQTVVTRFILLGFQDCHNGKGFLFLGFLLLYVVTVSGNLLIISLVAVSQSLSSSMYFFLSHLSSCDLLLSSVIAPLLMDIILTAKESISVSGCIGQFFLFGVLATTECLLLAVMSFDRYVAICNPLRYSSIMDLRRCIQLVIWSWFIPIFVMLTLAIQMGRLDFCGPNVIDHFFCDLAPILQLSCSDTTILEVQDFVAGLPLTFIPLMYITATYISIFAKILRIPTTNSRQKAFYTCSSHLTVVSIYYGTLIIVYLSFSKDHPSNISKLLSLLYTVITPLLNPIIYSFRNQEIKLAMSKLVNVIKIKY